MIFVDEKTISPAVFGFGLGLDQTGKGDRASGLDQYPQVVGTRARPRPYLISWWLQTRESVLLGLLLAASIVSVAAHTEGSQADEATVVALRRQLFQAIEPTREIAATAQGGNIQLEATQPQTHNFGLLVETEAAVRLIAIP